MWFGPAAACVAAVWLSLYWFDRQEAAVDFARARCEQPTAGVPTAAASSSSSPSPPPTCCVFQGELTSFASTHAYLVPPSSVHMTHCLVSSLKYLPSDAALMDHFAGVAATVVSRGGLYVIAMHLSDYSDSSTSSVDQHTAERDGVRVAATITCEPADRTARTEHIRVRMTVTQPADEPSDQQSAVAHYGWDETMRTYDRMEMWQLLSVLAERWFDVVGTFDYEQARSGRVGAPLEWPESLQTLNAAQDERQRAQIVADAGWSGWEAVEALAIVLKRR